MKVGRPRALELGGSRCPGWVYGPTKDAATKTHPCCVPYTELPPIQKVKDAYFEGMDQWGDTARTARGQTKDPDGSVVPAKPIIEVNLLDQPTQQILSEARQARLGINVKPRAGLRNTKASGYFKGQIRAIQVDSGAQECRLWALERTVKVGRGNYRIDTEFANDGDFDQDIVINRILDQSTVYWDVFSHRADHRRAEWCLVSDWVSPEEHTRRWPTKPPLVGSDAFADKEQPWYTLAGRKKTPAIRVAEYFRIKHAERVLAHHASTGIGWLDEMPETIQEMAKRQEPAVKLRTVDQRKLEYYIIDGHQVLEEHPRDGRFIPIDPERFATG